MTSLPKNLAIALTTFFLACGGQTSETSPSGSPSGSSPAENGTETTKAEDIPKAPFCGGARPGPAGIFFDALSPSPSAEYFSFRHNEGTIPGGLTEDLVVIAERGELCGGATDVAKCKAAYEKLNPDVSERGHYCFTRGDTVGCLERKTDAMAFLGEVHSIEEAFFVAEYDRYWAQCTYAETLARGEKLADGSFRLVAQDGGGCDDVINRATITVAKDGTVTEIDSQKTDLSYGCP